ncbi:winged helix-turn-helix transcriptional regulator [Trueperella pecoris]|nr:winged helix-turn-helix transcriptional regulator [Trueperella pecoris]
MDMERGLTEAARLFKVLGSDSRLGILRFLQEHPATVGTLVEKTGMTQPLVSQHLRVLRHTGLVTRDRQGKEVTYQIADFHVSHLIEDAIIHALENRPEGKGEDHD